MKYTIELRAVADQHVAIERKHQTFLAGLHALQAPWRPQGHEAPPPVGGELVTVVRASKVFGRGIVGDIVYQYRRPFRDEGIDDDYAALSFNPRKLDYRYAVDVAFPTLVSAFGAYFAGIADDEFVFLDYETGASRINSRRAVGRILPVSFFSSKLCTDAFGLNPAEVVKIFAEVAERAMVVGNGALIVLSSEPLPFEQMTEISDRATGLIWRDDRR